MADTPPPPGGVRQTPEQGVAAVFTAALTFGVYLPTLVFTLRWTLFSDRGWKRRNFVNWPMVSVTIFIFALTTTYTALDLKDTMDRIQLLRTNPSVTYSQPTWIGVAKCILANSTALSADLVLMYRCYTLYSKNLWIIAFPGFLWIGGIVCTILQAYLQIAHTTNPNIGPYQWALAHMNAGLGIVLIPFWGSTVLLNVYCTMLLLRRIRRASAESGVPTTTKQLRFVSRTIAESGLIYLSITLAHFFVWFAFNNFAINIIGALNVPLIGIAFNLILIRAAYSRVEDFKETVPGGVSAIDFGSNSSQTASVYQDPKVFNFQTTASSSHPSEHPV